jgi:hypothetical protein
MWLRIGKVGLALVNAVMNLHSDSIKYGEFLGWLKTGQFLRWDFPCGNAAADFLPINPIALFTVILSADILYSCCEMIKVSSGESHIRHNH